MLLLNHMFLTFVAAFILPSYISCDGCHIAPFPVLPRTTICISHNPFTMASSVNTNTVSSTLVDVPAKQHSGIKNVVSSSTLSRPQKISFEIQKADDFSETMDTLSWLGCIDGDARRRSPVMQRAHSTKTSQRPRILLTPLPTVPIASPLTSLPSFSSIPRSAPLPPTIISECVSEVKPLKVSKKLPSVKIIVSNVIKPFQFRERAQ